MSNRYDAFEERLVNLEDKLVALQEQVIRSTLILLSQCQIVFRLKYKYLRSGPHSILSLTMSTVLVEKLHRYRK